VATVPLKRGALPKDDIGRAVNTGKLKKQFEKSAVKKRRG